MNKGRVAPPDTCWVAARMAIKRNASSIEQLVQIVFFPEVSSLLSGCKNILVDSNELTVFTSCWAGQTEWFACISHWSLCEVVVAAPVPWVSPRYSSETLLNPCLLKASLAISGHCGLLTIMIYQDLKITAGELTMTNRYGFPQTQRSSSSLSFARFGGQFDCAQQWHQCLWGSIWVPA